MTSNQKIVIQQSKKFKFLLIRIVVHYTFFCRLILRRCVSYVSDTSDLVSNMPKDVYLHCFKNRPLRHVD